MIVSYIDIAAQTASREALHMLTTAASCVEAEYKYSNEQIWHDLYNWLLPIVEKWVSYAGITCWLGQQKEIAEDIAQEAIIRTFRYSQRASRGEVQPVVSLKSLSKVIAQNYFRDCRRKDQHLVHPPQYNTEVCTTMHEMVDPSEIALDHLIFKSIIVTAAQIMARFPDQQRIALLTDLANISDFDEPPTLLEQALCAEGIQLRDYNRPPPSDSSKRGCYAAHLCIAYKRLKKNVQI